MGLLDFSSKLVGGAQADALDDQAKREAFSQSMLQLAAGINPYGGNLLGDVARGLAGGRQVFGEAANRQATQGMNYQQLSEYWAQRGDAQKAQQYAELAQAQAKTEALTQRQQRLQEALGGGMTDMQGASIPSAGQASAPVSGNAAYTQQAERLARAGIQLMQQGDIEAGQKLIEQAERLNNLRTKADFQRLGNRVEAVDPYALGTKLDIGVSPDAALSNATTIRGQNISAETARRGQDISAATSRAGLAADMAKAGAKQAQKVVDAGNVVNMLETARGIIPEATGSYIGAGLDLAGRAVGKSFGGAQNIAKLKGIEAQLILNMPRLEGPQSNLDQQLYREAAGQIGDPTTPADTKLAAIAQIEDIYRRNAGMAPRDSVQTSAPKAQKGGIKFLGYE